MNNYEYVRLQKKRDYENMESDCNRIIPESRTFSDSIILPINKNENSPSFGWGGVG